MEKPITNTQFQWPIKANSPSTKHIVSHSHTYKNVQFQGSLFASSNNVYLWKSIIGSDIERSSNKNIQIYSINEWKRGRVFMELVLSLCHCQWWEQRANPTHHTYNAGYGWMLLISNIPAAIHAQYRLWGKFRDDDSWSVWQSWRSDTSEEIDGFGLFQVLKGSWRAARTPHNHISDTRSSMQSYLCGCYKINWDWWIRVWMSNSRYTIFHRDQNKVV